MQQISEANAAEQYQFRSVALKVA